MSEIRCAQADTANIDSLSLSGSSSGSSSSGGSVEHKHAGFPERRAHTRALPLGTHFKKHHHDPPQNKAEKISDLSERKGAGRGLEKKPGSPTGSVFRQKVAHIEGGALI